MATREKKKRKMPHLLVLILGLLILMSIMTYIIPAGEFGVDPATGKADSTQFTYLEGQTPVNPWEALLLIPTGLANAGSILAMLFTMGGLTGVVMQTKAIDKSIDFAVYKLRDKGIDVLVPALCVLFLIFGTFAGGDYVVAMVPIGLMLAKKLRVDPMVGFGSVMIASLFGMISSPTNVLVPQVIMGVPVYSGFGMRLLLMLPIYLIVTVYTWNYAKKVEKNPEKSVLGKGAWYAELDSEDAYEVKEAGMDGRSLLVTFLYFTQPIVVFGVSTIFGYGMEAITALSIVYAFGIGLLCRMSLDEISKSFAKGLTNMAFIGFLIGLSYTISLVMEQGNIMPTIINTFCIPLRNLNTGIAAIGISVVVAAINILIPSASAKAAVLCPLIAPMCNALNIPLQVGVSAFKYGDGITKSLSPFAGATLGGLEMAKIPFDRYLKWVIPLCCIVGVYCLATLYFLNVIGWTGV